ncbi:MAG: hypothetical protein KKC29_00610 [Alphaproteobacteria bacterium]|nr:hypothetical protein [Alphaproteobacteria bacterium]MBU2041287.1 hypothetical protein [Alphaproteobacteria bacterium]MBU2124729.1 hypothetical protein [Alphaproteobacteria bacterium]MBU2208576.1 hypothetical protein [Alphaproteobacteria bacterium]MBU2289588.1 hypothetical protein [Alphaproteobacteria bacterium]
MIRPLAAAAALVTLAFAGAVSAQTWGQPVYLNAYGRPVGGSTLSEVETRSYVGTGRWADGYSDRPQVHVPAPGYGQGYGYSQGRDRYGHGDDRGHGRYDRGHSRYDPPSRSGYRDAWGYNDDRPPSARRWSDDHRSRRYERDCGCGDVYLYDR